VTVRGWGGSRVELELRVDLYFSMSSHLNAQVLFNLKNVPKAPLKVVSTFLPSSS